MDEVDEVRVLAAKTSVQVLELATVLRTIIADCNRMLAMINSQSAQIDSLKDRISILESWTAPQ